MRLERHATVKERGGAGAAARAPRRGRRSVAPFDARGFGASTELGGGADRASRDEDEEEEEEEEEDAPDSCDVVYVRCAPASDEAPQGPSWPSANRRTRRPKFHDERPATPRCLLALPTEASSFP